MKLLNVPHYRQLTGSDCQAACAAMVLDYWARRADGGSPERIAELLARFSQGFRPESGECSPAITGRVALELARSGLAVDFYSENPYGGGVEGLNFLRDPPWKFTQEDVENYSAHAKEVLADAQQSGVIIHENKMSENDVESAIAAGKPVVVIVDLRVLKDWDKSANHCVVITWIDKTPVRINDPGESKAHKQYERDLFFEAHRRDETDCDAYIAARLHSFSYKCWNLDGHILASINGKEYIIDTGSPHTYVREGSVFIGDREVDGHPPPEQLMDALVRNVAPNIAGLIGLDVLSDYDVHISISRRSIVFHEGERSLPCSIPIDVERSAEGVPTLKQLAVNGRSFNALLDLGARFSYLAFPDSDKKQSFGSAWDFWPVSPDKDVFPVRLHDVTLCIAGRECCMTVGDRDDVPGLPDIEVVGSSVLEHFDINIALRRNLVEFLPIN